MWDRANARGGHQGDTNNPGGSRRGLATWGSSMLALGWTGWTLVSMQAAILLKSGM